MSSLSWSGSHVSDNSCINHTMLCCWCLFQHQLVLVSAGAHFRQSSRLVAAFSGQTQLMCGCECQPLLLWHAVLMGLACRSVLTIIMCSRLRSSLSHSSPTTLEALPPTPTTCSSSSSASTGCLCLSLVDLSTSAVGCRTQTVHASCCVVHRVCSGHTLMSGSAATAVSTPRCWGRLLVQLAAAVK